MLSRLKSLWVGERGGAGDTHIAYPEKNEGGWYVDKKTTEKKRRELMFEELWWLAFQECAWRRENKSLGWKKGRKEWEQNTLHPSPRPVFFIYNQRGELHTELEREWEGASHQQHSPWSSGGAIVNTLLGAGPADAERVLPVCLAFGAKHRSSFQTLQHT